MKTNKLVKFQLELLAVELYIIMKLLTEMNLIRNAKLVIAHYSKHIS